MESDIIKVFAEQGFGGILLAALIFVVWKILQRDEVTRDLHKQLHEDTRADRELDRKARKEDQDRFLSALDSLEKSFKCGYPKE